MSGSRTSKRGSGGTKPSTRWSTARRVAIFCALCSGPLSGCAGPSSGTPAHCVLPTEYVQGPIVDAQRVYIFAPDKAGTATRFREFAIRDDYLEARCRGINAFRGEKEQPPPPPEVE